MSSKDLTMGVVYLTQTVVGILGNVCFLYHCLWRSRPIDFILKHLMLANSLVFLSKGVTQTMASLGLKLFLSDAGCKVIFYVHKVGRGVSISTTCLLSVFQAIMISPRSSRWAEHKAKAPKYVGISVSLCWSLNMMLNSTVVLYVTGKLGKKNLTRKRDFGHCYVEFLDEITDSLNTVLVSIPDVFCLGLMLWASSNMVFILHRHKQQVQYIHRTSVSCQSAPETRATQSILVLVSTFVSFYTLSFIFHIYFSVVNHSSFWLVNTSVLTSACFPTVSPFVLMSRDSSALRLCFPWIRIT